MGRGKGHLNVSMRPLMAGRCNTNRSVTGLLSRAATRTGGDAAESFLPVVVPTQSAPAEAIATHGVVDVAALDVKTTKASGSGYMRIGAGCAKAVVATIHEVAIREAEVRVDWDGFQVSPLVPALETEQARVMQWGVARVEEICSGALSECVQQGGTCDPDLPGDIVHRHWDERVVGRQSQGLGRLQCRMALGEGAPERSTEGRTGRSVGAGGHEVKLREGEERWVCFGKSGVAMCRRS
jgi:hypothetical protein